MSTRRMNGQNYKRIMNSKQQDIWLKAAVIGSIWASFEIVFGSFFHSLRLPFAGTFLTFSSIVLLIAFSYKWNDKNLFLKAGIIAALMRSLMPTSVILGPLIGILAEALLFQVSINLSGRNFTGFAVAGILAMFSAILHKIISIILIYGFDIVKILENLYYALMRSTHINLPLNQLLLLVILIYTLAGIAAALLGMKLGKKAMTMQVQPVRINEKWQLKNDLFNIKDFHYRPGLIFLHITALVVFLVALEFYPLFYIIFPLLLYLAFILWRYGKSLRRLAKPVFWLQLLVIVLIAVWLWQDKTEGFWMGVKMVLRAVLVVSLFTAMSVELKNPLVKALLYKRGYSQLYATLGMATSAVPFILKNISEEKKTLFKPLKVLQKAISLSDVLLQEFTEQLRQKNKIYIISGDTRSGKTTFLKAVISNLKQINPAYKIGGIIATGIDKNGERFGFEIEELSSGKKFVLASQEMLDHSEKTGRFYFSRQVLKVANELIINKLYDINLLVIDEVGYMELKGSGWFESIEKAMQQEDLTMILVVRKRILEQVLQLWQDHYIEVIDIADYQPENLVSKITNLPL